MSKNYLGNNINTTLLVLIVVIVIVTVGTAIFFNKGLTKRTSDFETTFDNLTSCQAQVQNYQSELKSKAEELDSTTQDIRKYDQLYEQKVAQITDKDSQISQLTKEKNNAILLKEEFKNKYEVEKKKADGLLSDLNYEKQRYNSLSKSYDDLKDAKDLCTC